MATLCSARRAAPPPENPAAGDSDQSRPPGHGVRRYPAPCVSRRACGMHPPRIGRGSSPRRGLPITALPCGGARAHVDAPSLARRPGNKGGPVSPLCGEDWLPLSRASGVLPFAVVASGAVKLALFAVRALRGVADRGHRHRGPSRTARLRAPGHRWRVQRGLRNTEWSRCYRAARHEYASTREAHSSSPAPLRRPRSGHSRHGAPANHGPAPGACGSIRPGSVRFHEHPEAQSTERTIRCTIEPNEHGCSAGRALSKSQQFSRSGSISVRISRAFLRHLRPHSIYSILRLSMRSFYGGCVEGLARPAERRRA